MHLTSRLRHRLQLGAAILVSVGSVWIVSCVVNRAAHSARPVPAVRYVAPRPPLPPPPPVPKVISPPPAPHLSSAFLAALKEGDVKAMEETYTTGAPIGDALAPACAYGRLEPVKWILDHGADPHQSELAVDAPILQADDHPEIAKLLLERGAAEPPLAIAARAGAVHAVTRILARDKTAASPDDEPNPLVEAVASPASADKRRAIVDKLVAAGADVESGDPLSSAIASCETDDSSDCFAIVRTLVAKRAPVSGETIGAIVDHDESPARAKLLELVLAGKLEPDATAQAMAHLVGDRDDDAFRKIAARGVSWTYRDGENDAVAPLVDAVERQDVALVRLMLDAGAPADYAFKDGRCALGQAIAQASDGSAEPARMVELLVQRGANVNRRLPDGRTPLFAAAESGDVRTVNAILNAGARVNERVLDDTALDAAEKSGHLAVARVLDGHGGKRAPAKPIDE